MTTIATMDSWATEILEISKLPNIFRSEIERLISHNEGLHPYTVFLPKENNNTSNDAIILLYDNFMYIIELKDEHLISNRISFDHINLIELSIVLLNSHFRVNDGAVDKTLYFNTDREDIFHKIIDKIRFHQNSKFKRKINIDKLGYLKNLNLKLYNYSKFALCHHELIIDSVYQSVNEELGFSSSLTILTNNELIYIKEPKENNRPNTSLYGGTWTYIPLNKISNVKKQKTNSSYTFSMALDFEDNSFYNILYSLDTLSSFKEFDKKIPLSI